MIYSNVSTEPPSRNAHKEFQSQPKANISEWRSILFSKETHIPDQFMIAYRTNPDGSTCLIHDFKEIEADSKPDITIFIPTWKLIATAYNKVLQNSNEFDNTSTPPKIETKFHMFSKWKPQIFGIILSELKGKIIDLKFCLHVDWSKSFHYF